MKAKNREELQRASGIVEGASYVASEKVQSALTTAIEIIDQVLMSEEEDDETSN